MATELKEIFRKDYQAPNFWVTDVMLNFDLQTNATIVRTQLTLQKNLQREMRSFTLNGAPNIKLLECMVNGEILDPTHLINDENNIILNDLEDQTTLQLTCEINPIANTALEGLYLSNGIFCSDCEPEGFRHITFFPDRPDIMAKYTVRITADKTHYPVLLSNGNLIEKGDLDENKHYAIWHDPFPKPSYLFALVAGDLAFIEDRHLRPNGKPVTLRIYSSHEEIDQCHYALGALKRAMEWDESRYGLVCDLDYYNIVAIHDFNGGAMENKGLNIFNAKYVLANPEIATDSDFETIESIIGHEYFHNWTGNRITCRDWFQLSLKEGLTVFRDQEFTSDLHHRGLKRIDDVKLLRAHQFPEDAGKLRHPIRPESYVEMRNFYTTTVYEKGAEVVRLYQTLLGKEGFDKGLKYYIDKFDGTAATCSDFLSSMEAANNTQLTHFERWYSQSGTPRVKVTSHYDENGITLRFKQSLMPQTPSPQPQVIPIKYALISPSGDLSHEKTVILNDWEKTVTLNTQPSGTLSFLREFSAPIILEYEYSDEDLQTLILYETDDFARWEAMQNFFARIVASDEEIDDKKEKLNALFDELLQEAAKEPALFALLFTLPEASYIKTRYPDIDLLDLYETRQELIQYLAATFETNWAILYEAHPEDDVDCRAIKNCALSYLAYLNDHEDRIEAQYENAINMTDRFAALKCAAINCHYQRNTLLNDFLMRYENYPSVVDKWFSLQASNPTVTLITIDRLFKHPMFSLENPNRARSLLAAIGQNKIALYKNGIDMFEWLLESIETLDRINPQVAARLATPFSQLDYLPNDMQEEVRTLIQEMLKTSHSKNLTEQLSKSL